MCHQFMIKYFIKVATTLVDLLFIELMLHLSCKANVLATDCIFHMNTRLFTNELFIH